MRTTILKKKKNHFRQQTLDLLSSDQVATKSLAPIPIVGNLWALLRGGMKQYVIYIQFLPFINVTLLNHTYIHQQHIRLSNEHKPYKKIKQDNHERNNNQHIKNPQNPSQNRDKIFGRKPFTRQKTTLVVALL